MPTSSPSSATASASVFIFDYRGYGRSEGTPHEAGCIADGLAAQRWFANRIGEARAKSSSWVGRSAVLSPSQSPPTRAQSPRPRKHLLTDGRCRFPLSVVADAARHAKPLRLPRSHRQLPRPAHSKPRHGRHDRPHRNRPATIRRGRFHEQAVPGVSRNRPTTTGAGRPLVQARRLLEQNIQPEPAN